MISNKKLDNKFIKENEWIVRLVLKELKAYVDEDLLQEAMIWLIEGYYKWNENKSSWNTFAYGCIFWGYKNYIRDKFRQNKNPEYFGYKLVDFENINECDFVNNIDNEFCYQRNIFYDSIMNFIINPRTREIFRLRYLGNTYKEIAKKFNISKQRIQQIYESEIIRIKKKLEEQECKD